MVFLKQAGRIAKFNCFDRTYIAIRPGNDSHNIIKHHTNWRQQAIESLDREKLEELHYSAVISLSEEDILKVKNSLLEHLKSLLETIKTSKVEELYCLNFDFFSLDKQNERS